MAPLKLHTDGLSYNSARVEIALSEKGIEWEEVPVRLAQGEQKSAEFLKISPFGNVPVITLDDGTQIYESRAISKVVCSTHKGQGPDLIIEPGQKGYGDFETALQVEAMKFEPYASNIIFHKLIAPIIHQPSDPAVFERSKALLSKNLDILDQILAGRKYVAGDTYTLADINYIPEVSFLFYVGEGSLINDRPNLKRWWEEVSAREASKKALDKVTNVYNQVTGR